MRNDELSHSGVIGQRKGNRRYQNPDGTLTELGKQHYGSMYGWGQGGRTLGDATQKSASSWRTAAENMGKTKSTKIQRQYAEAARRKAATLSNDELAAINKRAELEMKYIKNNTPEVVTGHEKAMEILQVVGAGAMAISAIAGVAEVYAKWKLDNG